MYRFNSAISRRIIRQFRHNPTDSCRNILPLPKSAMICFTGRHFHLSDHQIIRIFFVFLVEQRVAVCKITDPEHFGVIIQKSRRSRGYAAPDFCRCLLISPAFFINGKPDIGFVCGFIILHGLTNSSFDHHRARKKNHKRLIAAGRYIVITIPPVHVVPYIVKLIFEISMIDNLTRSVNGWGRRCPSPHQPYRYRCTTQCSPNLFHFKTTSLLSVPARM